MTKIYHVLFLLLFLCICIDSYSQDGMAKIQSLEFDNRYYRGKGTALTLDEATRMAKEALANSISLKIKYNDKRKTIVINGRVNDVIKSEVQTISYISNLQHIRQIVVPGNVRKKTPFTVLYYVDTTFVEQMFREREEIVLDYIKQGKSKERDNEIGYAIMEYYKALALLNTSPIVYRMDYTEKGTTYKATNYLANKIETLMKSITVEASETDVQHNKGVALSFKYNNQLISGHIYFDCYAQYSMLNGLEANNGQSLVVYDEIPENMKMQISIDCYDIRNIHDDMVKEAISIMGKQRFQNATKNIFVSKSKKSTTKEEFARFEVKQGQEKIYTNHAMKFSALDKAEIKNVLLQIEKAINTGQYTNIKQHFTPEGYRRWEALINRGKARLIAQPNYSFLTFDTTTYCRGMRLQFDFDNNYRPIVEDVCFRFNEDYKIQSLSFCLSKSAEQDILSDRKQWGDTAKIVLLSFLEDYKTAYALMDTVYLEKIFSEDALIITGTMIKTKQQKNGDVYNIPQKRKYNTMYKIKSKDEFIADLKRNFKKKKWVNIMFEDVDVKRRVVDNYDMYGIQVKQNYFSSNYCDEGYLSISVNMENGVPEIFIRVWQEEKVDGLSADMMANEPGKVFDLGK